MTEPGQGGEADPRIDEFLAEPTRDLARWRWLWDGDHRFPISSHRGLLGRAIVLFKRVLRPLVQAPQNDLWDRQRVFNLILIERLQSLESRVGELDAHVKHLQAFLREGLDEVMRHNDALFARVDQKLDGYRAQSQDLLSQLRGALEVARGPGQDPTASGALDRALQEGSYLELENRYRGTREEIAERIARYLPFLEDRAPALDLGCGRGEALALLQGHGIEARGVDASAEMVRQCREQGLAAEAGDLLELLAAQAPESLGAVVSFHVVEHLPPGAVDRLVRLAWRGLRPGGVLILETPSPLSVLVGAQSFWLDPTHQRPVHPQSLRLAYELAGFTDVERLDLNPFPDSQRLPEIDLANLPEPQRPLADGINRLRDRLDEVLFGYQDYALVGFKG